MFSKTISPRLVALQNRCLNDYELPAPSYTFGGILQSSKHVWLSNGPNFLVCNAKTGRKVAGWTFGLVSKDNTIRIVCVDEIIKLNNVVLLVIGLESALTGGMICIFDMVSSKVLQAIQLRDKISSLHVFNCNTSILPHFLSCFNGVISVGIRGGDVYLLDFYRSTNENDEVNPAQIKVLSRDQINNIEYFKHDASVNGFYIAVHVNEVLHSNTHHFALKGPKGEDRLYVNREEVAVSTLYYCSRLASLLIGFNFGALQLWDVSELKLVYTSRINEDHMPVSYFAIQEPSDDPRAFFYFWAVCSNTEPYQAGFPVASFYSLVYNSKDWLDGFGYIYKDLQSCSLRFEMDLAVVGLKSKIVTAKGAQCTKLRSIKKGIVDRNVSVSDSVAQEESMALLYVVWNVWATDQQVYTFMNVFDLNQWYKEQMPNSINYSNSFLADFCISDMFVDGAEENLPLLDMQINERTIEQFVSIQRLEEHYCPSSLSFDFLTLSENDVQYIQNKGLQRALLYEIESVGPLSLIRANELYDRCLNLGLLPLYIDIPSGNPSLVFQRELVLSTALEQHLIGWLCKCASAWCNGSHSSAGCTNELLLNWAWNRGAVLKSNADKLCVSLFDHSELHPDNNILSLINGIVRQLTNLAAMYDFILRKLSNFLADPEIIGREYEQLHISAVYFKVLQWLLNVGLLPECATISPSKAFDRRSIVYPANTLVKYYNEKRAEMQRLNEDYFANKDSLLFIDNLIEVECKGVSLHEQWEKDGGNGSYPPASLQALLRTYLIESVDEYHKHCVIFYMFQDLISLLDQEKYKTVINYLKKFPIVFKLSPSQIKIVEAFWQFDRGDFEVAVKQLLDPLVNPQDLKTWHHKLVLRALLAQNQFKLALLYFQVQHPPVTNFEDICMVLAMYVTNNMIDEALLFLRKNQNAANEEEIFAHFYKVCDETGKIKSLVRHAITKQEEMFLLKYLHDINHPLIEEFKVVYFLQRSRYTDLLRLNEEAKLRKPEHMGLVGQSKTNMRERISKMLSSIVPKVTVNLGNNQLEGIKTDNKACQPAPLSVFVQDSFETISYKSKLYHSNWIKARKSHIKANINEMPSRKRLSSPDDKILSALEKERNPSLSSQIINETYFSPTKKRKINPQQSLRVPSETLNSFENSAMKFETPVVKRMSESTRYLTNDEFIVHTPPSILKSRRSAIVSPNTISMMEEEKVDVMPSLSDSAFTSTFAEKNVRITPRRSLLKTSVRFEDTPNTPAELIRERKETIVPTSIDKELHDSTKINEAEISSKDTTESSSSYYSPNIFKENSNESKSMDLENEISEKIQLLPKETPIESFSTERSRYEDSLVVEAEYFKNVEEVEFKSLDEPSLTPAKPKSRRSYKDSSTIRSSPRRLSKSQNIDEITTKESFQFEKTVSEVVTTPLLSPQSPRVKRISSRKSLTRQVLINNTISKELSKTEQSVSKSTEYEAEASISELDSSDDLYFNSNLKCSPMPVVDAILLELKQRREAVLRSNRKKEPEIVMKDKKTVENETVIEILHEEPQEPPEQMVVDEVVEKENKEVINVDCDPTNNSMETEQNTAETELPEIIKVTPPEAEVVESELNTQTKKDERQGDSEGSRELFDAAFIKDSSAEESPTAKIERTSVNVLDENDANGENAKDPIEKSEEETKPVQFRIISRSRLRHSSAEPDTQSNKRNLRSSIKTKTEEPRLGKRATRSASADEITPVRRSQRKSSTEQTVTTSPKRTLRPRKSSTDTMDSPATEKSTPKKPPRKRLTSTSTDESLLETSISKPTRRKRAASVTSTLSLPVIPENQINAGNLNKSRTTRKAASVHDSPIASSLDDYSATRRLTRRQKSLLEKTANMSKTLEKERSDSDVSDDEHRGPSLREIDPIILLTKVDFKGEKDPDEQKVLKSSPDTTKKRTKSKSVDSDASNVDDEELSVSKRVSNRKKRLPKIAE